MYQVNPLPIVLTGGEFVHNSNTSHAEKASELLMSYGIPESKIHVIPSGTTTYEESLAILGQSKYKRLAIVSSASHGYRIAQILEGTGITFTFIPVHYGTKSTSNSLFNMPSIDALKLSERAIYEYLAIVKFKLSR
jgi:uncharacterized SAM-binding protein YcdF (DUF218 family)